MSIEFDREAVGVAANENWHDADTFGAISALIEATDVDECVSDTPSGVGPKTKQMPGKVVAFKRMMRDVVAEFSDACAILGSGTDGAVANFDETESTESQSYLDLEARMSGEENE